MRRWRQGSYTVEAALLMGVLVPLLTGIIYLGFYLHELAFMQNTAYEIGAEASLHSNERDIEKRTESKKNKRFRGKLTGGSADADIRIGKKKVQITIREKWKLPGMILNLFQKGIQGVSVQTSMKLERPTEAILKIHAIQKWVKRGEEG